MAGEGFRRVGDIAGPLAGAPRRGRLALRWMGSRKSQSPAALVGRTRECAVIDSLLEAALQTARAARWSCAGTRGWARRRCSSTPPTRAGGMRVLRVTGVEAESDLAFAGLHGLVWPIIDELRNLPSLSERRSEAALGLARGEGRDRFLVSAGVLSLLAAAAESTPILCLVDDAQWLDVPSSDSLVFAARRLVAEGIVIVFGAREGELPPIRRDRAWTNSRSRGLIASVLSLCSVGAAGNWCLRCASGCWSRRQGIRWPCSNFPLGSQRRSSPAGRRCPRRCR